MKFRTALFAVILFFLATSQTVAQPDISQYIKNLRDIIAAVPVPDPTIRDALNELLDCVENTQPSKGGYARYTTTNKLLDAFQEQFITYMTEGDSEFEPKGPDAKRRRPNGPNLGKCGAGRSGALLQSPRVTAPGPRCR